MVDSVNSGFQCYNEKNKDGFYVSFYDGRTLLCTSPYEMEDVLKACKQGLPLPSVLYCAYSPDKSGFICPAEGGVQGVFPPNQMENYYCMSKQDIKRVMERCKPNG